MCALNVCLKCTPNCQSRLYTYATRARVRCVYTVYMCVYTLRRHRLRYVSSYVCLCVRSLTHTCSYVCSHTRRADMDGDAISRARNHVLQRGPQVRFPWKSILCVVSKSILSVISMIAVAVTHRHTACSICRRHGACRPSVLA